MGTYLMVAFLLFGIMFAYTSSTLKNLELKKTNIENKYIASKSYDEAVKHIINLRGTYLKIYGLYPASVNELISKGLLEAEFISSEYGKDIFLNSDGSISITNRDIGNVLKNQFLVSNQTNLLTQKSVDNTEALIEQKRRFNTLKQNEKSIVIGNDISISKRSDSFSTPSLKSSNTISETNNTTLRGW